MKIDLSSESGNDGGKETIQSIEGDQLARKA